METMRRLPGHTTSIQRALSNWKKKLKENGSKAFGGGDELKEKKDKIAKLEQQGPSRKRSKSPY
jgi:hypothetical protein